MPDDDSALKVINEFKARQRQRLAEICRLAGAGDHELLTTTLVLLMEGTRSNRQSMGAESLSAQFASSAQATVKLFMQKRPSDRSG